MVRFYRSSGSIEHLSSVVGERDMNDHEYTVKTTFNPSRVLITQEAAPVAEWMRSLIFGALNHSIISPL